MKNISLFKKIVFPNVKKIDRYKKDILIFPIKYFNMQGDEKKYFSEC